MRGFVVHGGRGQAFTHFLVGRRSEIAIPKPDRLEWVGLERTNHHSDLTFEFLARFDGSNRDRDDQPMRPPFANGRDRGAHGEARGKSVVDENRDATGDTHGRSIVAILFLAAMQLGDFARGYSRDGLLRHGELANRVLIQHLKSADGNRANGELLETRRAEFAYNDHIELRRECPRDFESDGNAASGECEYHGVVG